MKKLTFFLATTFVCICTIGQTPDVTETNCDAQSNSVYAELNSGKSLLVVASGFDCGICISEAPSVASWANEHTTEVKVWGAMHYRYPGGQPTCAQLEDWVNDYNWRNVYTFLDTNNNTPKHWAITGYPTYQVIDPTTQEIAYSGTSFSQAKQVALQKSQITAIAEWKAPSSSFDFVLQNETVKLTGVNKSGTFFLYDSLGKIVFEQSASENREINLSNIPTGQMYFGVLKSNEQVVSKRIILD